MRTIIYGDSPVDSPETSNALARSLATVEPTETNFKPLTRTLVGRPGLDPGTLGLKGTFNPLRCVGLVAHVVCFQGIVLF
jgi:hypothetical protein